MGVIRVVGLGPGSLDSMTFKARSVIENSDVIVGYHFYVDLVKEIWGDKNIISTGMTHEVDRCKLALQEALNGSIVSLVCSGDATIYGMAALMMEVAEGSNIDVEVIPGMTAAICVSAVLGAPLTNDFAVISLSDYMTPWETIIKRLECVSSLDFIISLYNPKSKKRVDHLNQAVNAMLKYKSENTPCGYVRHASRDGEFSKICTLKELPGEDIDMFTNVIVGNSSTVVLSGKLVTPRGYKL